MKSMVIFHGDNPFSFLAGLATTGLTMTILSIQMPVYIPPLITMMTAVAGGFCGMLGKDLYKKAKARWAAKKKPKV